ncbi:pyridoxamine 5'-phosphate oxidase family protein [Mycobacterium sp. SMC-8]|uniref:pyridoxamine 5'-phosphate oxidase family protein n=1 Tax=Mycobacterium sp. SMC-8 TaxID=2857060 RepID=UPI0021B2B27F|nr:pyridoxamine 5'-phosphate oxidase family protein [Mycobacterium sp. SMC-8]UXA13808.1 pyridoxamine 5'-phosphate oxidase family protein [Mycobacterium sp. SMC-8]
MTAVETALTREDRNFLRRPLHGFLTVAAGPVPPQPRPVWFELTADDTIELFTAAGAAKVRQLRADPRASLVVAAPVGERERWVSLTGPVTVAPDGAADLARRLAARYWDLDDPVRAAHLEAMLADEHLRVVLWPQRVSRVAV